MRNAVVGMVVGLVVGVVLGVTFIAPRLKASLPAAAQEALAAKPQPVPAKSPPLVIESASAAPETPKAAPAVPAAPPQESLLPPEKPRPPVVRWRMESAFAARLPQLGSQAKRIETETWRISDGAMEIKFHEPGSLVRDPEMIAAVKSGTLDAAFVAPDAWPAHVPALQLFGAIPFGPKAEEYLAWLYFGGGEKLLQEIAQDLGVQILVCGLISPEGSGWFRRPIKTVDDLKGLKLRMTGLGARVMSRLGAETVTLAEGDIFHAMETGAIDAAEYSMPAIDATLGLHRMARNYYFPGWHQPTTLLGLVINRARWEALPPVQRSQLRAVCGDNVRHGLAEGEALQYRALLNLTKEGVAVRRWPKEILDSLEKAWLQVAHQEAKADKGFAKVWKSLNDFRKDYAVWRDLGR